MSAENSAEVTTNLATPRQRRIANMQEDILSEIFYLLSRDVDTKVELGLEWDWVPTTEVCRYWNAVAARTPKLWSLINKFRNTARLHKFIRLSKDADLYIIYNTPSYWPLYPEDFSNLKIALKEMRRVAHLALTGRIAEERVVQLLPYLELPAPRMRSITLGSFLDFSPRLPVLSTSSDVLKCVSLGHISKAPPFSCLSRLTLRRCDFTLSDFWRTLEACPELESLYLSHCNFARSNISDIELVHLPRLEQLYVKEVSNALDIIQNIEAPNVLRWYFACDKDDVAKVDALATLLQREYHAEEISIHVRYYSSIPWSPAAIDVVIRPDKAQEDRGHASLQLQFYDDEGKMRDLNRALQHRIQIFKQRMANIPVLHISDEDDSVTRDTWNSVFRVCTSATALKIHIGIREDSGLESLFALAHVYQNPFESHHSAENPTIVMNFPNLEHLIIYNVWAGDPTQFLIALENVLKTRSANGVPIRKMTIYSGHVTQRNTGMLQQWVKDIEFINELLHLDLVKELW